MKYRILIIFVIHLLFANIPAHAGGMSRSKGLGLRVAFWNVTNRQTRIQASDYGSKASIDLGGAGTSLYFFSRMYQNWFLELNFGAIGGVHSEHSNYVVETTEATAVLSTLFGTRYDILSVRLPSAIQPYLTFGGGPYWTSKIRQNDFELGGEAVIDSELMYGAYFGGGMNVMIASWFALNFDLKYHAVDFQLEKGYSGLEFGAGFSFMWGAHREIFVVKDIKLIVSDLYPAYYQFYNLYPIALITLKNVAGYPIEVNIKSTIDPYSERPGFTGFQRIGSGKTVDVPVTVILGSRLLDVTSREPAVLDLEITARAGKTHVRSLSAPIVVHNKNAWNGDVDKLDIFVTPDDEDILVRSRGFLKNLETHNDKMAMAEIIFDRLSESGIGYKSDPNIPFYRDDRVQYAGETLEIGGGDCDDLVVLYASFLESVGISTAFVDVRYPEKEIAHLYLLFDTGIDADEGYRIASNEKRYIVRERPDGSSTAWIPVETTLIAEGFNAAWEAGASAYLQEAVVENGLIDGWVRIFDVE